MKFDNLFSAQSSLINEVGITNISSRSLSEPERRVLKRGLNFSTGHNKKDALNTLASLEPTIDRLNINDDDKNSIRHRISNCLANVPKVDNLPADEKQALRDLKSDESIVVVKSDKGNGTVVINKVDYDNKIVTFE